MANDSRMIVCLSCSALNRVPAGRPLSAGRCGRCSTELATLEPAEISNDQLRLLEKQDTGAFIVDLWAPWCGPCRMMAPAYTSAAKALQDEVRFFKVNTDQHPDAAIRLNIRGVPTLIAWSGGREIVHQPGAQSGPALERWIRSIFHLSPASS